ncbi:MAG: helix-turn-helix domain-containing protein [Polaromonas sp.]|nr:helix-turn-helix domain-containing protein [Polaromonas sp.]
MNISVENVLSAQEVAEYLRINQHSIYHLTIKGKIPGFKVGITWRLKRSRVDAWLAGQSNQAYGKSTS